MDKECEDSHELIEMCMECTLPDCVGERGCQKYRQAKTKLLHPESPEPRLMIQPISNGMNAEREILLLCNKAINALDSLLNHESMNMTLPTGTMKACLNQMREARSAAYIHLVDWDAIAGSITEDL